MCFSWWFIGSNTIAYWDRLQLQKNLIFVSNKFIDADQAELNLKIFFARPGSRQLDLKLVLMFIFIKPSPLTTTLTNIFNKPPSGWYSSTSFNFNYWNIFCKKRLAWNFWKIPTLARVTLKSLNLVFLFIHQRTSFGLILLIGIVAFVFPLLLLQVVVEVAGEAQLRSLLLQLLARQLFSHVYDVIVVGGDVAEDVVVVGLLLGLVLVEGGVGGSVAIELFLE